MNNRQAAAVLYEVADLPEIKDVRFKPVAYRRAWHGMETLAEDINKVAGRGRAGDGLRLLKREVSWQGLCTARSTGTH